MPEASVNKNGPLMLSICEVGLARQNCHMLPETYPKRVNGGARNDFGTRILRPYACHHLRSREWRPFAAWCDLWKRGLHLDFDALSRDWATAALGKQHYPNWGHWQQRQQQSAVPSDAAVRRYTEIDCADLLADRGRLKRAMNGFPKYDWLLAIESKTCREHRDVCDVEVSVWAVFQGLQNALHGGCPRETACWRHAAGARTEDR